MNYIWGGIIVLSIIFSFINGNVGDTLNAGLSAAGDSVKTVLSFAGILCMWTGIMNIADNCGFTQIISKLLTPITKFLFPDIPPKSKAMQCITMNMSANLLGMGNAATPLGISAMEEMHKLNNFSKRPSDSMCMFVIFNTASITLIPSTVIAIRAANGSADPFEIVPVVWIASLIGVILSVSVLRIFFRIEKLGKIGKSRDEKWK